MNQQPEALRLADVFDKKGYAVFTDDMRKAAAELRRLHAENSDFRATIDHLTRENAEQIGEIVALKEQLGLKLLEPLREMGAGDAEAIAEADAAGRPFPRQDADLLSPRRYGHRKSRRRNGELLELAAKAAGLAIVGSIPSFLHDDDWLETTDNGPDMLWNPLQNDGDALRLAVKLKMTLGVGVARGDAGEATEFDLCHRDPCAATRRAIVRAAAEIGRSLK